MADRQGSAHLFREGDGHEQLLAVGAADPAGRFPEAATPTTTSTSGSAAFVLTTSARNGTRIPQSASGASTATASMTGRELRIPA